MVGTALSKELRLEAVPVSQHARTRESVAALQRELMSKPSGKMGKCHIGRPPPLAVAEQKLLEVVSV